MPSLMSLPRELRDFIYREVMRGPLRLEQGKGLRIKKHAREGGLLFIYGGSPEGAVEVRRVHEQPGAQVAETPTSSIWNMADDDYANGDEAVRYEAGKPLPPTTPLLQTSRQVRAEMQDVIGRSPVRYKIRLAMRRKGPVLYPTWVSVPALSRHIDLLEAELRVRWNKTSSLWSTAESTAESGTGDALFAGMVLLRRFLERGVGLLGKKRIGGPETTVGALVLRIAPEDFGEIDAERLFLDCIEAIHDLFVGFGEWTGPVANRHRDDWIRFFAERVASFECRVNDHAKVFVMEDVVKEMDRGPRDIRQPSAFMYI